jgi:hypothetical protein
LRHAIRNFFKTILFILAAIAIGFSAGWCFADDKSGQNKDHLLDTYHQITSRLESSSFGVPLILESSEQGQRMHVDIYGIFDYQFKGVVDALNVPSNWCDIVSLHPNVKACTYEEEESKWLLTFFIGRKINQSLEDTHQVICRYRNVDQQPGYQDIVLAAAKGPFGTMDHKMRFEAIPIDEERTFVHVSYSYSDSASLRLAARIYFATIGREKVGFTVIGKDGKDAPRYIGGPRGAIERSAIRYYFAIQSFMDTSRSSEELRFSQRINRWYDLTTRFKTQLFDQEKTEYLKVKTSEHATQVRLQNEQNTDNLKE